MISSQSEPGKEPLQTLVSLKTLSRSQLISRSAFLGLCLIFLSTSLLCLTLAIPLVNEPFPGFLVNERMVLAYVGPSHWTGTQAGLKFPDQLLAANGQLLTDSRRLSALVHQTPPGEPIRYTIQRGEQVLEQTVATMRFTWSDLLLAFGLTFLIGILFFLLGAIIFVLKPDTQVSWVFLIACFFLSISNIIAFDYLSTHAGLVRVYLFCIPYLGASVIHLSLVFPERTSLGIRFPSIPILAYGLATLCAVPMVVVYPDPRFLPIYEVALMYMAGSTLLFVGTIARSFWKTRSVLARMRAKLILWGAALALPIPAVTPLMSFLGISIVGVPTTLGIIPMMVFPASIGYAIAKHNLFDADVYIKRTVGYGLMTVLVAVAYFSIQSLVGPFLLEPLFGKAAEQVYPLVFALLVVFAFNPVFAAVQNGVDTVFFRRKFDYKATVASVSNALVSLLEEKAIVHKLIETVRTEMFVDAAGVLLLDDTGRLQGFLTREGTDASPGVTLQETSWPTEDSLFSLVAQEKKMVTKYDVTEDAQFKYLKDSCLRAFADMGASLAFPLFQQKEVRGIFTIGYKKSGHFFTRDDVDLLGTLANQASVALETAQLANKMRKEETVRANLARYLSPQIVDRVVKNDVQVNLGGNRKVVTILFSDIRNFTTISESWPPEQLVQILNEYFTAMAQIIFEHQGSLDKYIGDAIVAVFGSLIPLHNPSLQAVRASVAMIRRMPELNAEWERQYGFSMDIGIGVNTGEVFLGNVGSPERMEFTVIGDAVNVASRFSGLAKGGKILLTRATLDTMGRTISTLELEPTLVKGKSKKLEVFEVVMPDPSKQMHSLSDPLSGSSE